MSNPYTKPSISGFNANPPADDGSQVASNEVTWQKHLDKIGTPIKNYVDAINQEARDAFGLTFLSGISAQSTDYTVQTSDRGKLISVTNTTTITLLPAATAGSGFPLAIRNAGSGTVTVDGDGSETINGAATVGLAAGETLVITTDGTAWEGYVVLSEDGNVKGNITFSGGNTFSGTNTFSGILNATGTLQIGGLDVPYAEARFDLNGDFNASAEECVAVRVGNIVTITANVGLQHTSSSTPSSAAGVVPSAMRPSIFVKNVYEINSTAIHEIGVAVDGTISFSYIDYAGSAVAKTTAIQPTISYVLGGNIA